MTGEKPSGGLLRSGTVTHLLSIRIELALHVLPVFLSKFRWFCLAAHWITYQGPMRPWRSIVVAILVLDHPECSSHSRRPSR